MIAKTFFCISTDETRYHLNGVLFESRRHRRAHGLDRRPPPVEGRAAARRRRRSSRSGIIIPRKGLIEMRRALETAEGAVELGIHNGHLFVRVGRRRALGQADRRAVPAVRAGHPEGERQGRASRRAWRCWRRSSASAHVVGQDLGRQARASTKGELTVASDNPDLGEAREELDVELRRARRCRSGSTRKYFIELLGEMDGDEVRLELDGELDPGLVRPADGKRELPRRRHADAHLSSSRASRTLAAASFATSSRSCSSRTRGSTCCPATTGRARPTCSRRSTCSARCARFAPARPRRWCASARREARVRARVGEAGDASAMLEVALGAAGTSTARLDGKAVRARATTSAGSTWSCSRPRTSRLPRGAAGGAAALPRPRGVERASGLPRARSQTYEKVLRSRNAVLARRPGPRDELLEVYDEQLARAAVRDRHAAAARCVEELAPRVRGGVRARRRRPGSHSASRYETGARGGDYRAVDVASS